MSRRVLERGGMSRSTRVAVGDHQSGTARILAVGDVSRTARLLAVGDDQSGTARLLAVGDLHFKASNGEETEILSRELVRIARETQPDLVVLLGDLLHTNERIHMVPLCSVVSLVRELSLVAPVMILVGNHDRRNPSEYLTEYHPFTAFSGDPRVEVADRVLRKTIAGHDLLFVPYVPPGSFADALATMPDSLSSSLIFCHQEFRGCSLREGVKSEQGDPWPLDYPQIIAGHIHDRHRPQPNILYVGVPMQESVNEDSDTSVSLLTLSQQGLREERLRPQVPRKWNLRVLVSEVQEFTPPEGNVRVVLVGTRTQLKQALRHPRVQSWVAQGVRLGREIVELIPVEEEVKGDYRDLLTKTITGRDRERELLLLLDKTLREIS